MTRLLQGEETYRATGKTPRRKGAFARSEDGSLIIFALFLLIIMFTAGGIGVDFMRLEAQRARLQSTLDRAVLAAASLDQPLDPATVVLDYFDRAGLSSVISADDITVTDSAFSRKVTASASMNIDTTLLNFAGIGYLTVPASGAAEESTSVTEISLVLDVSGSMNNYSDGSTKIQILRDAATQFVNMMLCDPSDPTSTTNCTVESGKVSISLIPYSEQVLLNPDDLSLFNVTNEQNSSSCVTFDASDFTTTAIDQTATLKRTGHFDPWSSSNYSASDWTCQTNSWRQVAPIDGDASDLRTRISNLQAYGNTSIDVGMKWGTTFLDPSVQPQVSDMVTNGEVDADYDGRPLSYDGSSVSKVIVLMTDGVNTSQHYLYDSYRDGNSEVWKASSSDSYSVYDSSRGQYYWDDTGTWSDHPFGSGTSTVTSCNWSYSYYYGWRYTCTNVTEDGAGATQLTYPQLWAAKPWSWYEQFYWLGTPGSYYGYTTKNSRLQDICDAAKAQDITVYTIGFETTTTSGQILKNCASSSAHFYNVSGLDLVDAFNAIARDISKLRLVN